MTIKEFLTDINGMDVETRKPKSAITIQLQIVNLVTGKPTVVKSFSIHRPTVEVKKRGDFLELNLVFNDDKDVNLRTIWSILEDYGHRMNVLMDDAKNVPQILLMAVPIKDNGKKFLYMFDPITWYPKPKAPGLKNNILSILLQINKVNFIDNYELDEEVIEAELQREQMQERDIQSKDYE